MAFHASAALGFVVLEMTANGALRSFVFDVVCGLPHKPVRAELVEALPFDKLPSTSSLRQAPFDKLRANGVDHPVARRPTTATRR
jgi:hypothetical protein